MRRLWVRIPSRPPKFKNGRERSSLTIFARWQKHCRGLYQMPNCCVILVIRHRQLANPVQISCPFVPPRMRDSYSPMCRVHRLRALDVPQTANALPLVQVGTQVYLLDKRNLERDSLGLTLGVYLQLNVRWWWIASFGRPSCRDQTTYSTTSSATLWHSSLSGLSENGTFGRYLRVEHQEPRSLPCCSALFFASTD